MKRLPPIERDDQLQRRQVELGRWLREWEIDQSLGGEDTGHQTTPRLNAMPQAAVERGQIRLLAPVGKATAVRPRYVAVMTQSNKDGWVVVPFSRFQEPALPGEWRMRREEGPVRVVCVWNSVTMADPYLTAGWVVDGLTPSELEAVEGLYHWLSHRETGCPVAEDEIGPPLVHPLDPRHEYVAQERAWLARLSSRAHERKGSIRYPSVDSRNLPMAAEDRAEYGPDTDGDATSPGDE